MFEFSTEYKSYIASDRWKLVCKRYWMLYGKRCQACGSRKNLQVHHKTYTRFGREAMKDLCGLCSVCHREVHRIHRSNRRIDLKLVTERFVRSRSISLKHRDSR